MARIRAVEISNSHVSIERLKWCPSPGFNCLIGPGDSGKSSVLDAIDMCLGARRSLSITDADFHALNVAEPIVIVGDARRPRSHSPQHGQPRALSAGILGPARGSGR